MREHTPGPWMLGNQLGKTESTWILDSELLTVAMVNDARRKEWKANACLISAAPELLKACNRAIAFHGGNLRAMGTPWDEMKIAIAKA